MPLPVRLIHGFGEIIPHSFLAKDQAMAVIREAVGADVRRNMKERG
jgi:hypothetical protein